MGALSCSRAFLTFGSLVKNCNHKRLGIYYLLSAFIFGISSTLISVLMRIELYSSGNRIISPENQNFYNKHNLAWVSYDLLFSNARLVWRIWKLFCTYFSRVSRSGISSCLTSLNFWVTILNLRSYCLTLKTMPLFPWA